MEKYYVIKKDGRREDYDPNKIITAVNKSSLRVLYRELNSEEIKEILDYVKKHLDLQGQEEITFPFTHGYNGKNVIGQPEWFDSYGNRGIGIAEMAWAMRGNRKDNRCSKEYGLHCMEVLIGMDRTAFLTAGLLALQAAIGFLHHMQCH